MLEANTENNSGSFDDILVEMPSGIYLSIPSETLKWILLQITPKNCIDYS